jgi:hypothetical protein
VTVTSAKTANLLEPLISETYIVKSLHVTNKAAVNTPTISITNNGFQVINTQTLTAATSVEILTNPMVVEGNTVLSFTTAGTVGDGVDITISYLNIKKEVTV